MLLRVLTAALGLLAFALLVVLVPLLRDPAAARRRIEALFRRPAKSDKPLEADHYYRPYWS
jgi:hypothetical protein